MSQPDAIERAYGEFYRTRGADHVYPVEFVVRALLGNYPRLKTDRSTYPGKRVLDLGCGDGRNMPLMSDLGMEVHGIEISQEICDITAARMSRLGVKVTMRIGRNASIPYGDASFDLLVACHSCYYVDKETRFSDNVREIGRVLRPGGSFVFSAPMPSGYALKGAKELGDGHMQITNDPYGLRNGAVFRKFDRESEISDALAPYFEAFSIGSCRNDFWGIEEHMWVVVCRRSAWRFNNRGT